MQQYISKFMEALTQCFAAMLSIVDTLPRDEFVVVYIVNPFRMISTLISQYVGQLQAASFSTSKMYCETMKAISQAISQSVANKPEIGQMMARCNINYQFLDLDEVISAYEMRPLSLFKKISHSTYDKLRRVRRWAIAKKGSDYAQMLHEPLIVLSPPVPCLSSSCMPDDRIERHQHTYLHCAYTVLAETITPSSNSRSSSNNSNECELYLSICASWSDCTGHLMESEVYNHQVTFETAHLERVRRDAFNAIFQEINHRSFVYMSSLHNTTDQKVEGSQSYWNYVICRYDDSVDKVRDSFQSIELGLWKHICDQTGTHNLAILGSISVVSVNNSHLQVMIDNVNESQLNDIRSHPDYSNSFVIIDSCDPALATTPTTTTLADDMATTTTSTTATILKPKAKGYVVSSLGNNPYLLKERQVLQTSVITNLNEQDYRTLEVKLFEVRQIACNFPMHGQTSPIHDFFHKLCKQYHDLSWLTVSSTQPFRETNLPAHLRLLQNLKQNLTYLNRHTTNVTGQ